MVTVSEVPNSRFLIQGVDEQTPAMWTVVSPAYRVNVPAYSNYNGGWCVNIKSTNGYIEYIFGYQLRTINTFGIFARQPTRVDIYTRIYKLDGSYYNKTWNTTASSFFSETNQTGNVTLYATNSNPYVSIRLIGGGYGTYDNYIYFAGSFFGLTGERAVNSKTNNLKVIHNNIIPSLNIPLKSHPKFIQYPGIDGFESGSYTINPVWTKTGGCNVEVSSVAAKNGIYGLRVYRNFVDVTAMNFTHASKVSNGKTVDFTINFKRKMNPPTLGYFELLNGSGTRIAYIDFRNNQYIIIPGLSNTQITGYVQEQWFKIVCSITANSSAINVKIYDQNNNVINDVSGTTSTAIANDVTMKINQEYMSDSSYYIYLDDITYGETS